jgi:hypothetical protein
MHLNEVGHEKSNSRFQQPETWKVKPEKNKKNDPQKNGEKAVKKNEKSQTLECLRKIYPAYFGAFEIPGTFSFFGVVLDFSVFLTETCRKYGFSNFRDPSEIWKISGPEKSNPGVNPGNFHSLNTLSQKYENTKIRKYWTTIILSQRG